MASNKILEKFEKRLSQLHQADHGSFQSTLIEFWNFFDSEPALVKIRNKTIEIIPNLDEFVENRLHGPNSTENLSLEYQNAITLELLRKVAYIDHNRFRGAIKGSILPTTFDFIGAGGQDGLDNKEIKAFKSKYLNRLQNFIENQFETVINDEERQNEILERLVRYKHRCEWFEFERLYDIFKQKTDEKSRNAEKALAMDLYAYLYEHGIDFYIEPNSVKGSVDLISAQKDKSFLADAKIFDGASRAKPYICKGFVQLFTYTKQYNQIFGFLIIYNVSNIDLELELPSSEYQLPYFDYNGKTIYFLTIDVYPNPVPVSQRKELKSAQIRNYDLVRYIEESEINEIAD